MTDLIDTLLADQQQKTDSRVVEAHKPTEEQAAAYEVLAKWWAGREPNIIVSGQPGTGKTWLVRHIVNRLKGAVPLYTAPTNEAVRQLQISLGRDAATKTTYSAFGLKMSIHSEVAFITQGKVPEDLDDFNLLIVDESSMVGEKLKATDRELLADYVLSYGKRTIWLGDEAQLPPVESADGTSPIFKKDWPRIHLSQVVRHSGPILEFATAVRTQVFARVRNLPKVPEGIATIPAYKFVEALGAPGDVFDAHVTGRARTIVWTNKRADQLNSVIRKQRFGADVAEQHALLPGDSILFTKPLMHHQYMLSRELSLRSLEDLEIRHSINTKAEVIKVEEATLLEVPVLRVGLEVEGGCYSVAYVPAPGKGEATYKALMARLTQEAKVARSSGPAWALKHTVDSCFCSYKHAYCITGHRSQGATIPEVFVDVGDLLRNPDRIVAFKNLYVAVTRAKDKLTLVRG